MIVSAFATRGLCADVMRLVQSQHEPVTARIILEEVERALDKKFRMPSELIAADLDLLRDWPIQALAAPPRETPVSDPDDARILATAIAAGADILVTGDKDLLDVRDRIKGIVVTDPRGFWEMHRR